MKKPWKLVKTERGYIPVPEFPMICPFCGEVMLLHRFSAHQQRQVMGYPPRMGEFYHVDINLKCPNCGWYTVFGVPISKDDFYKLRDSGLARKLINLEDVLLVAKIYNADMKKIEERLKALGYW